MFMKPRYKKAIISIVLLGSLICAVPVYSQDERIIKGVRLGKLDLGNMGWQDYENAISMIEEGFSRNKASFKIGDEIILNMSYEELGIKADRAKIWQEAYQIGRKGNWFERTWTRLVVGRRGQVVNFYFAIDRERLNNTIRLKTSSHRKDPQDARFMITSQNEVVILPEIFGSDIDMEKAFADLEQKLYNLKPGGPILLELRKIDVKPSRLKQDLQAYGITGLIGKFSTLFNPGKANRSLNIRLSAQALDNVLVAPNQVFSFNQTVGPRIKERGYDEADIILNNELVPGVGGGVCQVSTTLYNTALLACLEIVERHPHSLVIPYVEPGLDATVNYGSKDFKFLNNMESYLLIKSQIKDSTLIIKMFGQAKSYQNKAVIKSEKEKEIAPQTVYKEEPDVPEGQYILEREGIPGLVIRVDRYIYNNKGKLLNKEFISRDYYNAVDRIIKTFSDSPLLSNSKNL